MATLKSHIFTTSKYPDNITAMELYAAALLGVIFLLIQRLFISTSDDPKSRIHRSTSILRRPALSIQTAFSPSRPLQKTKLHGSCLGPLPTREDSKVRPALSPTTPPTQSTHLSPLHIANALANYIHELNSTYPRSTYLGRSSFEGPLPAPSLYARQKTVPETEYLGMICSVQPESGSVYARLHPEDITTVADAGWGVHDSSDYVTVYAPRNEIELAAVMGICRAAVAWVGEGELEIGQD